MFDVDVMWRMNCRKKLSHLTYPPCGFNEYDNNTNQFVIFNPRSCCFEEIVQFDVTALLASRPVPRLISWYNESGDITKEFWEKATSSTGLSMDWKLQAVMILTVKKTMAILLIDNTNDGNMDFCNSNMQCVINQATSDTKIKLADNMWEYLL